MSRSIILSNDLPLHAAGLLETLRTRGPRVHCLMNTVVQKFVADGLTAFGVLPSMTSSAEEVASFVRRADALTVNLGTLDSQRRQAIMLGVETANAHGKRWVLDPAHCDYSTVRAGFADDLLLAGATVLRANGAEYGLLSVPPTTVAVQTGMLDRVTLGAHTLIIANGHPMAAKVTGTGCLSGALIAAFLAVADDAFSAAAAATLVFGIAAEIAAKRARGPGSFEPELIDALAGLDGDAIVQNARVSHEQG